jgi:TRAP-type C4-dicarboxylate transport system permease small subunit
VQRPRFSHALDRVERACLVGAAFALVAMALVQAWQVFGRYVLNASPGWTEPVALVLMSLSVMLGSAVAVRQEIHFSFAMLAESGPPARRAADHRGERLVGLRPRGGLPAPDPRRRLHHLRHGAQS